MKFILNSFTNTLPTQDKLKLWGKSFSDKSAEVPYQMSVASSHTEPVGRKLREGVDIVAGNQDILLNSKEEFLQGAVPSTRVQRGFGR